jgi:hypothetical protein
MKHFLVIPTVFTLALAAAGSAAAEPASSGSGDVSQLEGQLVPVGDTNRYQYSYKKFNASTNPFGLITGSYGASLSYAPHERFAVRGDVNYYQPTGGDVRGFELGIGAPVYFRKIYSGVFLEPGVIVRSLSADDSDASATVFGPQVLLGYHWYWDSGLNVAIAAGVGRNWNSSKSEEFENYDELFGNAYLRFGYAF